MSSAERPRSAFEARRESVPRPFAELTGDQQRAALQAIGLMEWIARNRVERRGSEAESGLARVIARIDRQRFNHNVLIDGGRGSGKTSVLLSVLEYWREVAVPSRDAADVVAPFAQRLAQLQSAAGAQDPRAGPLERTPPLIVPMGIIDLQPLTESTDLRVYVASRFRRVMEGLDTAGDLPARWAPAAKGAADVHDAWAAFRDSAAAGSDHLRARRAHLDSETYAVELELAEYNRHVESAFARFIDALRDAYMASPLTDWGRLRPFFVLPIDDADMNPRLAAHLIETINLLSHEDVGYLLTGDSDLFLLLLREHLAGGMRHSLRSVDLEGEDARNLGDLLYLRSLAHQIYDKHFPNAHRCRIEPLPGSQRVETLRHELSAVQARFEALPAERSEEEPELRERTLGYYFDLPLPPQAQIPGTRAADADRFTDAALPATLRGIEETREYIRGLGRRMDAREWRSEDVVSHVVRHLWRERINGSLLPSQARRDLIDVVRLEEPDLVQSHAQPTPPAAPARTASGEKFVVQNARLERDVLTRTLRSGELLREHRWSLREILDYEFRTRTTLLSGSVQAALILATDVVADLPDGTFVGKPLSPDELETPFVVTSVLGSREGEFFDLSWPMPDWDAFRDFHLFSRGWAGIVAGLPSAAFDSPFALDALAYPYVLLVASIAYARHAGRITRGQFSLVEPTPPDALLNAWLARTEHPPALEEDWATLMASIREHLLSATQAFRRDQVFRHWFDNRLVLLAAPESGLSPALANQLYGMLVQRRGSTGFDDLARGARLARAKRARVGGGKESGNSLRAAYGDRLDDVADRLLWEIDHGATFARGTRTYRYPRHQSQQQSETVAARKKKESSATSES